MSDSKESFVNRHGKKMTAEASSTETLPNEKVYIAPIKKNKKTKRRSKRPVKKLLTVLGIILLGILLIPVLSGELVAARYSASRDGARSQLAEFTSKTVIPAQKKQMTLSQLSEASVKLEKIRDDACDGGFTDNLASLYPRAKSALDDCIAFKQKVAAIAVNLRDMESQVRYLETLVPIIGPMTKPPTDEFAVISAQLTNWRALHEAVSKLSPAASQKAAHDQLKVRAKAIVDAWSALNTAYDNQDAAAFADAEKKLSGSYEAFRSSSAALSKILDGTQTKLTASYKVL